MMKSVLLLCFVSLTIAEKDKIFVDRAMLDEAISKMQDDDFMSMLKLMMSNGTQKLKVETRRLVEYEDMSASQPVQEMDVHSDKKLMTVTVHEDGMPLTPPESNFLKLRNLGRSSVEENMPVFNAEPKFLIADQIATGNVGICKTLYKVEKIATAILMKSPNRPKVTLAHQIPVAVGKCRQTYPAKGTGPLEGKCVLAAQAHIAWILVPTNESKDFNNCITIPGVSSLMKCPDWIIVGGRCVFDTEMQS